MALSERILGVKGDECDCGRRKSVRHCIDCGSTRVYVRQNKMHTLRLSGEKRFVETQFRCQGCGCLFIDEEREWCEAPPATPALAKLKAQRLFEASKNNEYLSPEVIVKAQELAGQTRPNEISRNLKAIAESEAEPVSVDIDPALPQEMRETASEVVEHLQKTERQPNREAMRTFLEEWSQYRYARGREKVPTFEEFAKRRLKGETAEVIVGE